MANGTSDESKSAPTSSEQAKRPPQRLLLRGESMVAWAGMALAAILLCTMAGSAWWAMRTQRAHIAEASQRHVDAVAAVLTSTSELMLARDELSPLRRLISEASQRHDLAACRVVLLDGQVLADATASEITTHEMPAEWPEGAAVDAERTVADNQVRMLVPLRVPGRGDAVLELEGRIEQPVGVLWEAQAGVGLIGATALFALLLGYRYTRQRLRALGAIREALLAIERGEQSAAALAINQELGHEAAAWNSMLQQTETLRHEMTAERARVSLQQHTQPRGDLDEAWDAMPQGLLLVDSHMRVKYANGAASVFLQRDREALLHQDVREMIADEQVAEVLRGWGDGGPRRRAVVETQSGETAGQAVLRWTVRPGRREDAVAAMIVIEDITQQRVAEEARHAFVAQATHELRTPLTNIRLYVETALDEGEEDAAVRAKCLNVINSESRRLERVVNDMLSTAEIEAGSLQAKRDDVRLATIFEDVKSDYAAQAADKNIELTFNLPPKLPVIQADRDMVVLAIHNLVSNALKYTPDGGAVTVNVEMEADQIRIDVSDTGFGISEEDQQRIFDKFYRAQDRRISGITGSGLGLALAREVVRLHGGDITVQASEMDKGSTFRMTMPAAEEAA